MPAKTNFVNEKHHGYSVASLQKVVTLMTECRKSYDAKLPDQIRICISKGNKKIGRVMNVSTAPILGCPNCKECMWLCYDIKACLQYPQTVIDARIRNLVLATKYRDIFFDEIDKAMSRRRKNKYFRWHVAGDILDYDYFCRMVENARRHPDFIIWTYTKAYWFVNKYCRENGRDAIPSNFSIMFSEWDGMDLDNPYNFPTFSCKLKAGNRNHPAEYFNTLYRCPGNCDVCKALHRGCIAGEHTYADEH